MEQKKSGYSMDISQSEECVIILVALTITIGVVSIAPQTQNALPLVIAFGLSAIAVSIFHLGNTLSKQQT
ncbi:MAG: hypothetical protein EAX87_13015 [Candidatus Thorarchaeota archaeon]|nr:hypothetical protein [Candidatus Thorarchaeota archaeon]